MSAIDQSAFAAASEITPMPPPPLLWREWTGRSWLNRLVGWAKVRSASRTRRAPAEPIEPRGPGEPPEEPESASWMDDPAFWMLLTH
jgi:hypothetical protein